MAFKGAANMTDSGWRKAAKDRGYFSLAYQREQSQQIEYKKWTIQQLSQL